MSSAPFRLLTIASLLVALVAWSPVAAPALAQSAGDEQYSDPIVGGGGGDRPASPPTSEGSPAPSPPPTEAAPSDSTVAPAAPAPATGSEAAATGALPRTGADAWLFALIGFALAAGGLMLRRQTAGR